MGRDGVTLTMCRAADRRPTGWKNGGGTTSQIAGAPEGAGTEGFDWRVSVADIATGGPFSTFVGVDRVIILLDGDAVDLDVDGARHRLLPLRPFAFAGEATTVCSLTAGPTRDLNVMARRARFRAEVEIRELFTDDPTAVPGGDPLILVTLSGSVGVAASEGARVQLETLDAVTTSDPAGVVLVGKGTVAVVRMARLA